MMSRLSLFQLMNVMFIGFGIALAFGIIASGVVWLFETSDTFRRFLEAYFVSFNCLISGGLIIGSAIFVFRSQRTIPMLIEQAFDPQSLNETKFHEQKRKYLSLRRTLTFSTDFIAVAFVIFYFCKFPFRGLPEYLLIFCGCLQYALGVYMGRKLFYVAQMLAAIQDIRLTKNIFKDDDLGHIISYVNVLSTLTIIFVYVHVTSYYNGPFEYSSMVSSSLRIGLILPAVIATPVLVIFNFYPRAVLRQLYSRCIADQVDRLTDRLRHHGLSDYERMSCVIEYDKLWKDELRSRLRLTLSDLPIAITIIAMVVGLVVKR
jgi:hypothetical protein